MTVKDETPAKEEPEIYVPVAEAVPAPAAAVPVAEAKPPHVNPSHNAPPATSSSSGARIQVPAAPTAVVNGQRHVYEFKLFPNICLAIFTFLCTYFC